MLKCNQVTRLAATDEFREMGFFKKLEFRMHLMMCSHCRRYVDQMQRLGQGARDSRPDLEADPEQLEKMEKNIRMDLKEK